MLMPARIYIYVHVYVGESIIVCLEMCVFMPVDDSRCHTGKQSPRFAVMTLVVRFA